ncbi:MAG: virginiamycin B lyase family protein [Pirellulaceae bacterium]
MIRSTLFIALLIVAGPAWCQESGNTPEEITAVRVETLAAEVDGGSGGVAVDADGNVYTADFGSQLGRGGTGGHRVYRITPDGDVSLFCEEMRGASGNCFDAEGNLFQSNIGGNKISRVAPDGTVTDFCSEGLTNPVGIIIDDEGTLFVGNCGSSSIQRITADGESTQFVKSNLLKCPNGITRDDAGNLYVANFYNGDVVKITPNAEASVLATLPGNNNGHLTYRGGYLYVVARTANQIYRVSLDGDMELFAGSGTRGKDDGAPAEATFSLPNDLAFSPDGQFLYVNEVGPIEGNPRVLAPTRVRRIVVNQE